MRIAVTVDCAAPPEVAFATHIDIPNWPRFVRGIDAVEFLAPGPLKVGSRFRETRQLGERVLSSVLTIAVMQAPWRLVFTGNERGARLIAATEIVPLGEGSRLSLTFESMPAGWRARLRALFSGGFAAAMRRQLESDIADIAREAERRIGR